MNLKWLLHADEPETRNGLHVQQAYAYATLVFGLAGPSSRGPTSSSDFPASTAQANIDMWCMPYDYWETRIAVASGRRRYVSIWPTGFLSLP